MSEEIEFGLTIMAVGMITVFSILSFVVLGGKTMILLINKFATNIEETTPPQEENQSISNKKIAILSSAVSVVILGKGKIKNIEKL